MDGYFLNPRRRLFGTDNTPTIPMNPPSGQTRLSDLHGVPGHQPQDPAYRVRSTVLPDQWDPPQTRSGRVRQLGNGAVGDNPFGSSDTEDLGVDKPRNSKRVIGVDLENRRRQAEDRIRRGGWKVDIAEMAVEFAEAHSWNDSDANNYTVRAFMRDAENLGELCDDMKAIRGFLDMNIHKFIAFHAMEKDFKVLDYFIHKANQRRGDRVLKYPWFRSFIREYQGGPRQTEESLVQAYKSQVDEPQSSGHTDQPARENSDGTIHVSLPTEPATVATDASPARHVNNPSNERRLVRLDNKRHRTKRQRIFDDPKDLEDNNLMTNIKTEPTEDDFIGFQDEGDEADTGGADDGEEIIHTRRRTLKVLLHEMRDDGAEESDHVQVYVPRTSKGVTINFL
ncbi:hypothetical protein INS49_014394 [Diaporthe citri]|uniref:uncharacterized protein n=1 Tax=Diaporthe citri TaxID=83186 RepID=UPI001C7F4BF5|nr:uncharacterized protein INS49_014394 [Diaporthe citri]KAG6358510.1 hypothetical protein INS49_014394 [Diaporthe citri]